MRLTEAGAIDFLVSAHAVRYPGASPFLVARYRNEVVSVVRDLLAAGVTLSLTVEPVKAPRPTFTPEQIAAKAKALHDTKCGCPKGVTEDWLEYAELELALEAARA